MNTQEGRGRRSRRTAGQSFSFLERSANRTGRRTLAPETLEPRFMLDGLGVLDGTVFHDLDHDRIQSPGEPGLEGWTVQLQRVGSTNVAERTFENPTPDDWSQFGRFVATAGNNVVIGSHYDDVSGFPDSGAAYVFDAATGDLRHTLVSPNAAEGDRFGRAVAGLGNHLIVGAPSDDTAAHDAGAAYLYDGTTGRLLSSFFSPTPTINAQFGRAVAAVGDHVLVGARLADLVLQDTVINDAGAAYLFDAETGQLLQTYISPNPTEGAQFGYSVAAMGENVLVGARYDETGADGIGAVYLFDGKSGNLLQSFLNPTQRASGDASDFGRTVAAAGNNVLVGARWDDTADYQAGSAFLFDGATGELLHTLTSPTPFGGEEFGFSVAAFGDDALVGARWDNRQDDVGDGNGGAVYLYDGATGKLMQTFANPTPGAWDAFGIGVAAEGDQVVVGTQYGNAAYSFEAIPFSPTVSTDADGNYRFTELPAGTYRVIADSRDGYVQTSQAGHRTFTVDIENEEHLVGLDFGFAEDELPVAHDDRYTVTEDEVLTIGGNDGVLQNDTDADDDHLTAFVVHQPPHGILTLLDDGSFQYEPNNNFAGSDSFTYRSNDGLADSNLATVTITVEPVNDAPTANDDGLWVAVNTRRVVEAPGVLLDDVDGDGDPLTAALVDRPSHGTVTLQPDGSFAYVPRVGYVGDDHFTYKVTDGTSDSNAATVQVHVSDEIYESLLRITEVNYAPYSLTPEERDLGIETRDAFEFIELQNTGDRRINLAGLQLSGGVQFMLDDTTWLEPGRRALVVKDRTAFETRYGGGLTILGEYFGDLANSGEEIVLRNPFDEIILSFEYDRTDDWPVRTHGFGSTLEVIDTRGDYSVGSNWRPSRLHGGSPGTEGAVAPTVVINELLTHANFPLTDAIELHNVTGDTIDVGGWFLSDTANDLRQFRIPDDTVIAAGGNLTFDEYDFNPGRWQPRAGGFALDSSRGEGVWLTAADADGNLTKFVDQVQFGAALNGESLGRWPNATGELYPMKQLTLGGNNIGPRVGPMIISEVMYNPPDPGNGIRPENLEFIEIFNSSDTPLDTPNWSVRGGVDFDFPTAYGFPVPDNIPGRITLEPHQALVLVGFDPIRERDTERAFREYYGLEKSVRIAGPFEGNINNATDTVRLIRPDYPPDWEPHHFPDVLEDEVTYDDSGSWPTSADGFGDSLHRRRTDLWGNDATSWQAKAPTPGTVDLTFGSLAVSELNYNPHDATEDELAVDDALNNDAFEFIELLNFGEEPMELGGVRFGAGIDFEFPLDTTLAPGESIVVVKNITAFQLRYGTEITSVGPYAGSLRNSGEQITLESPQYGRILEFVYSDRGSWPIRADGEGSSLELFGFDGDYSDSANWRPSSEYGGSPGRTGNGPVGDVLINEVLSRPDGDLADTIELYNASEDDVDIGGWFLSDSSRNLRKFSIPTDTTIPGHGYVVFDEHDFNPGRWDPEQDGFALSSEGEDLFLTVADAEGAQLYFADHVQFGAAHVGESFGRWPDGSGQLSPMKRRSLGNENSGPRVGPVVISELVYHPREPGVAVDPELLEFVEVYNSSNATVDLTAWQIAEGIEFQFAAGTTLAPRDSIVITAFDPRDANMLPIFRHHYRIDESVTLVGPFSRQLSNAGETVQLLRAEGRPAGEPGETVMLLEDEVSYDDGAPWPSQADGYGHALHRRGASLWGNDPSSWISTWPTPGMGIVAAGDANRDGVFDSTDLVQVFQAGEYEDSLANNSTWEEGDWNGDGDFDSADMVTAFQSGVYELPLPLRIKSHVKASDLAAAVDWIFLELGSDKKLPAFVA